VKRCNNNRMIGESGDCSFPSLRCSIGRVEIVPCIYCDETDPFRFSGREHVVPQAFGKFGSKTPTLKCVCDGCNAIFGRELDQILARDTLEGMLRYNQGKRSTEKRAQRRLRITLADESEAEGFVGAVLEGVDPTNLQLMPLATQLQIKNLTTGETEIFKRAELGKFALPADTFGKPGERELVVYAPTKEEHDAFIVELNLAGFDMRMDGASISGITPSIDANGAETLGVHVEATFDQLHRRALAKILVNFAAYYLGIATVNSFEWTPLKRFVRYAEGSLGARLSKKPFWTGQETDSLRFPDAINIRLENHEKGIVGVIQFYNQITYELLLVEGHSLVREMAARFEIGKEPTLGERRPRTLI
jgi:hypothetical protein